MRKWLAGRVVVNDEGHPTGSMHGSIGDVDGDGLTLTCWWSTCGTAPFIAIPEGPV